MSQLEITRFDEPQLAKAAAFVHRAINHAPASDQDQPVTAGFSPDQFLEILRWRSVDNPARVPGLEFGHCIRRQDGSIAGTNFLFPLAYIWGTRRLLGLASHTFFADDDVRIQAFFLFRRFLAIKSVDFFFANTCNANSSRIWEKCGGRPAPESDRQWLLPLRAGPLAREVLIRRGWKRSAAVVEPIANLGNLLLRRLPATQLEIQQTTDLEFMANMAERWRDESKLVPHRTVDYFRWQYERCPASVRKTTYRFRDAGGREGWFAVRVGSMGIDEYLNVATISDWAVPFPRFDFSSLVATVAREYRGAIDAVVFRPRADIETPVGLPRLRQRSYPAPQCYIIPASVEERDKGWEAHWITSQADSV